MLRVSDGLHSLILSAQLVKTFMIVLLMASACMASGPKRSFDDPLLNDELDNVYHDIDSVLRGTVRISSATISTATISNLRGVTDGSNACAGCVGEYVEATTTANTAEPTSTQYGDLISISLTAGDWDVTGIVYHSQEAATWARADAGISTTSGNNATGLTTGITLVFGGWASSATTPTVVVLGVPDVRMSVSGTTTVYLKFAATYSLGAPLARGGRISARRVR